MKIRDVFSFVILLMMNSSVLHANVTYKHGLKIRQTISLDKEWHFELKDIPDAKKITFNDSLWRIIDVPHDWAFENGYSQNGAQGARGGYTDGGIGWYRKDITLSQQQLSQGHRLFLSFDGIYMNSEVWINGNYLGKRPYGYISFDYEITSLVESGTNVISVRVDNHLEPSARWHHGCGIYGDVSLIVTGSAFLDDSSLFVTTPRITNDSATVHIECSPNISDNHTDFWVDYTLFSPKNKKIVEKNNNKLINGELGKQIIISNPKLWDIDSPNLYTLVVRIKNKKEYVDEKRIRFGIRQIEWKAKTGFWLNGKNLKIHGVCEHLEGGPVGAALSENMLRWKIKLLKEMGCNSIRVAHNPQVPKFYDICDEEGILVMDEIFDGWKKKATFDYGYQAFDDWWERDLRSWIRRDRNHPSVFIYSIGNETSGEIASTLLKTCHEEDDTRFVTSGDSERDEMDVIGINGNSEKKHFLLNYKPDVKAFIGTENPHTWQVRGYYRTQTWYRDGYPNAKQDPFHTPNLSPTEIFNYEWAPSSKWTNSKQHFNSSYDNAYVRINVRQELNYLRDKSWYSGSYRWTGFDYIGEAGFVHGGWPFRAFMGGALDLAGFKKDLFYLYQSEWTSTPMVHILPHWSHPDMKEGTLIPVQIYTTGDSVELFLNGRSLGIKRKGEKWEDMACLWMVPWEKGVLQAIAYKNDKEIARTHQETVDAPTSLYLKNEKSYLTGQDNDLSIVNIAQNGENGIVYPYGENRIYFHLTGEGQIYSAENGNPTDVETNWRAKSKCAFFGQLKVFIRCHNSQQALLHVGAILGDKRLKKTDKISIDVRAIDLKSQYVPAEDYRIYYTTDGTEPTRNSTQYQKPFSINDGTVVRAIVFLKDLKLFEMSERFGQHEGLYWAKL